MLMSTETEVNYGHPISMMDGWRHLEGRAFVLGLPNALGQHIVTLGDKRWQIEHGGAQAGDRVRVTRMMDEVLIVERVA